MANGTQTVSAVITADAKPFKRSVQDASKSFDGFSKSVKNFGVIAGAAILGASAAMGAFIGKSIAAAAESEAVAQGLKNAAENAGVFAEQAGGIAGVTEELQIFAKQLGETIGLDDEKILGIVSQWLAVPQLAKLGVGGLKNLVKVAADVAAGTNKDLDTIATAFVKVAGDGETALSKLLRAGIVFTDEQKAVYESLLASNDELGAQQYLIDTLGTKYAGAAEAIANPFDRLKTIFENFQEEIGQRFLPILDDTVDKAQKVLEALASDPEFLKFIDDLAGSFQDLAKEAGDALPKMVELARDVLPVLVELVPLATDLLVEFARQLGLSGDEAEGATEGVSGLVDIVAGLRAAIEFVIEKQKAFDKALNDSGLNAFLIGSPLLGLSGQFDAVSNAIKIAIAMYEGFVRLVTNNPNYTFFAPGSPVGGADYLDRVITPPPTYADDRRFQRSSTVNISVNAIAPSAEVGRAVVDSLRDYQRAGGAI